MWKHLKSIINPVNNNKVNKIIFRENNSITVSENEHEIAENFNKYFVNSVSNISNSISQSEEWSSSNYPVINSSLSKFKLLTMVELRKIIHSLDNKNKSEVLNSKFLKETFEVFGHVILNLVNTSLDKGIFPDQLKITSVIPIPKISNTIEASEFRPINTLPTLEKVLELAVYEQLVTYFDNNKLFLGQQSGFRKNHSCESAIQYTFSKWKNAYDDNEYTVAVFLDFKRAFETIDRNILIKKLNYYGVTGSVLAWFVNYLSGRKQRTKIGSNISDVIDINIGVPQGSVLGPLLFIIYLNDIYHVPGAHELNLFADDTLIYTSNLDLNIAVDTLKGSMKSIEKYLQKNKLKLNAVKTKVMVIATKYKLNSIDYNEIKFEIDNTALEYVSEIKYLGIIVDNTLSLNSHAEYFKKFQKNYISFLE